MAKSQAKKHKAKVTQPRVANLDLEGDAWPKFEALVKSAAKMGHKPHEKSGSTKTSKSK